MSGTAMIDHSKAIADFRLAMKEAKKLLPKISDLNETQKRTILNCALEGLDQSDLPYYSRAINLLMGYRDKTISIKGKWVSKYMQRGQIRKRLPDVTNIVMVDRI